MSLFDFTEFYWVKFNAVPEEMYRAFEGSNDDLKDKNITIEAHHCIVTHRKGKEVNDVIYTEEPEPEAKYVAQAERLRKSGFFKDGRVEMSAAVEMDTEHYVVDKLGYNKLEEVPPDAIVTIVLHGLPVR